MYYTVILCVAPILNGSSPKGIRGPWLFMKQDKHIIVHCNMYNDIYIYIYIHIYIYISHVYIYIYIYICTLLYHSIAYCEQIALVVRVTDRARYNTNHLCSV